MKQPTTQSQKDLSGYRINVRRRIFWYIKLVHRNGQTLMTSETYFNRASAERAARKLSINTGIPWLVRD